MPLKFEQRRDRHAIGEFSAALKFFQPISANALAKAVTELAAYAREKNLPAPVHAQVFTISLGQTPPQKPAAQPVAGWQRFASNGEIEISVFCDNNKIQYSTRDYTAWDDIRLILGEFFPRIAKHYITEVPAVTVFEIRYLNEFRNRSAEFDPGIELFREPSSWIIPGPARFKDAWHSHCGWFEKVAQNRRRLINVNVDCKVASLPEVQRPVTVLNATLVVSERYDVPDESPLVIAPTSLEHQIMAHLDAAHTREKEILVELFTDDYLRLMGAMP